MYEYRNVGLFRYWTISNIPLFLLAAPTVFVLCKSSIWAWSGDIDVFEDATTRRSRAVEPDFQRACLRRLAVPQALLAIMALLSYHVQVITRLSSAYPLWYMWLVSSIEVSYRRGPKDPDFVKPSTIVRWMVIYALLQGVLFASFLPPA
jgi:GPI mannosyltransferase 2